jgi:hypothetical protein
MVTRCHYLLFWVKGIHSTTILFIKIHVNIPPSSNWCLPSVLLTNNFYVISFISHVFFMPHSSLINSIFDENNKLWCSLCNFLLSCWVHIPSSVPCSQTPSVRDSFTQAEFSFMYYILVFTILNSGWKTKYFEPLNIMYLNTFLHVWW